MRFKYGPALGAKQAVVRRIVGAGGRVRIADRLDRLSAVFAAGFHERILAPKTTGHLRVAIGHISGSRSLKGPISDIPYFTLMRCDVRIEPVAGSFEGDSGTFGQLVSSLKILPCTLFQCFHRIFIDAQVGPHSRLQHFMGLAIQGLLRLHGKLMMLRSHSRYVKSQATRDRTCGKVRFDRGFRQYLTLTKEDVVIEFLKRRGLLPPRACPLSPGTIGRSERFRPLKNGRGPGMKITLRQVPGPHCRPAGGGAAGRSFPK